MKSVKLTAGSETVGSKECKAEAKGCCRTGERNGEHVAKRNTARKLTHDAVTGDVVRVAGTAEELNVTEPEGTFSVKVNSLMLSPLRGVPFGTSENVTFGGVNEALGTTNGAASTRR
ncbi:MAG: hypothetical protein M3032_08185 [Verrucomicrobiota bacterium]|nr:hypothetical protein [Verrucomicrobiota bacterium]